MRNIFKDIVKKGKACGYCPNYILKKNEAGGIIHFIDGKPACVRCRVLKADRANKISKINEVIEKQLQSNANKKVQEFALRNQILTKTGRLQANK